MKTLLKNPANLLIVLIMILTMAFPLSCSSDDDGDDDPFSGLPGYEEYKERLKYYDPDDSEERCQNGVVEFICNLPSVNVWYNPLKQGCNEVAWTCPSDGECYGTYEIGTIERCGSGAYISSPNGKARCQSGVIQGKCGDAWYNTETHYCDDIYDSDTRTYIDTLKAKIRCGNKYYWYEEDYTRCENGVYERKCGYSDSPTWYNYETQYCSYNYDSSTPTYTVKPMEYCGSRYLDGDYERCNNGVIESECGYDENSTWYNRITQICNHNTYTVKNKVKCSN